MKTTEIKTPKGYTRHYHRYMHGHRLVRFVRGKVEVVANPFQDGFRVYRIEHGKVTANVSGETFCRTAWSANRAVAHLSR